MTDQQSEGQREERVLQQALAVSVRQIQEQLQRSITMLQHLQSSPEEAAKYWITPELIAVDLMKKKLAMKVLLTIRDDTNTYNLLKELCSDKGIDILQTASAELMTGKMESPIMIVSWEVYTAVSDFMIHTQQCDLTTEAPLIRVNLTGYFEQFVSAAITRASLRGTEDGFRDAYFANLTERQEEVDFRAEVAEHRSKDRERQLDALHLTKVKKLHDELMNACAPAILSFKLSFPNPRTAINFSYQEITGLSLEIFEACGDALQHMEGMPIFPAFHSLLTHQGGGNDLLWLQEHKLSSPDIEVTKMLNVIAGVRKLNKDLWQKIEALFPHIYLPLTDLYESRDGDNESFSE